MSTILNQLREYWREHFHGGLYVTVALLVALACWYNYEVDFKRQIMNATFGRWQEVPYYVLFYGLPYYGTVLIATRCYRETAVLRSGSFWLVSLVMMVVLAANRSLLYLPHAIPGWLDLPRETHELSRRLLVNVIRALGFFLPVWLYWRLADRGQGDLYGLRRRGFDTRTFSLLLLAVVPLIVLASLRTSFQKTYPIYTPGVAEAFLGLPSWLTYAAHEITYAGRFISIELMFRGFMILGMVRWLGRSTLLPMVALYAFWHFGKPPAEAVSSVFGAYILGVIALKSRNIVGCIFLHAGLALLMNLAALGQSWVARG